MVLCPKPSSTSRPTDGRCVAVTRTPPVQAFQVPDVSAGSGGARAGTGPGAGPTTGSVVGMARAGAGAGAGAGSGTGTLEAAVDGPPAMSNAAASMMLTSVRTSEGLQSSRNGLSKSRQRSEETSAASPASPASSTSSRVLDTGPGSARRNRRRRRQARGSVGSVSAASSRSRNSSPFVSASPALQLAGALAFSQRGV